MRDPRRKRDNRIVAYTNEGEFEFASQFEASYFANRLVSSVRGVAASGPHLPKLFTGRRREPGHTHSKPSRGVPPRDRAKPGGTSVALITHAAAPRPARHGLARMSPRGKESHALVGKRSHLAHSNDVNTNQVAGH